MLQQKSCSEQQLIQLKNIRHLLPVILLLASLIVLTACRPDTGTTTTSAQSVPSQNSITTGTSASSGSTGSLQGSQTTVTSLGSQTSESTGNGEIHMRINAAAAKKIIDDNKNAIILDVRTPEENRELRIPGSVLIPLQVLSNRLDELPKSADRPILVYCRSGNRSAQAAALLEQNGFPAVYDFGGIMDWPYETEKG